MNVLKANQNEVEISLENLLKIINALLNKHTSKKAMTKIELKTRSKPWLTSGILTSVKNKNEIYNKFCKAKGQARKQHLHEKFKIYRNSLTNLKRQSKQNYYKKYFKENKTNLIKVWKGIKEIILINKSNQTQPACLKIGNKNISNKKKPSKEFNNFLGTIAERIGKKTPKSNEQFSNYLKNQNLSLFFLDAVAEDETESITAKLNSRKAIGPNSIPTHILKEFKNILKIPLTIIINISFQTGIFPKKC